VPRDPRHVLVDRTGLQIYGAGQWLEAKHGTKTRRGWRKLHLQLVKVTIDLALPRLHLQASSVF
jgi:hypothetical protein